MDPFRNLTMGDDPKQLDQEALLRNGPQGAIALGLALRHAGDQSS